MKRILAGRAGKTVAATMAVLLASSLAFAGPALARPAGTWFYDYFELAKASKVSTGSGVTVAVVDSGVQANLPDLAGRVLPGKSFVGLGGDARTDVATPGAPQYGHGTAMAGFIAATGKGTGYRGVAPGAKILPSGIGNRDGSVSAEATAQAITWSVDKGAKIINVSSGAVGACPASMQKAVDHATSRDVMVVASVGNSASAPIGSPANCIGVIGVGVLAQSETFGAWSGESTGTDIDFIAPGQNLSTLLLTRTVSTPTGTGSSESAALASGAFALLRAKFPQDSARQIVTRAMYSLQTKAGRAKYGTRINDQIGYGSLQPQYALTMNPPAGAANPIYDEIDKHLKAGAASSGASGGASTAPSSASGAKPDASGDDSSGTSTVLVALIVAVVVVVAVVIIVVVARARRTPAGPAGGYGPPPGGYPPPPGGHPPPGGYGPPPNGPGRG